MLSVAARRLSLVAMSGGCSLAVGTGSRACRLGFTVVAHGLSCPTACGIFPNPRANPGPCIGRQILNQGAAGEVPVFYSFVRNYQARFIHVEQMLKEMQDFVFFSLFNPSHM